MAKDRDKLKGGEKDRSGQYRNWATPLTASRPAKDSGPAVDNGGNMGSDFPNPMGYPVGQKGRK